MNQGEEKPAELREGWVIYGGVIRRNFLKIAIISLALALAVYAVGQRLGTTYEVHFSYLVSLSEREQMASDYQFDGYYALQAAAVFSETLARWVTVPEVVAQAYQGAGLLVPGRQILGRAVKAEKAAPQLVAVTVSGRTEAEARKLAAAVRAVASKNIEGYQDQSVPALRFRVEATPEWVAREEIAKEVMAAATFVFALFLGINVVLLGEAVRRS